MITKNKRYNIALDEKTDDLIKKIVHETEWKICLVFQKGVELLNQQLENKKNEKRK